MEVSTDATTAPPRRGYLRILLALSILTILEVAVALVPGHRDQVIATLFALALVKASLVALYFMHLKWETRVLKALVSIPLGLPVLYAVVLISEAAWRRLG